MSRDFISMVNKTVHFLSFSRSFSSDKSPKEVARSLLYYDLYNGEEKFIKLYFLEQKSNHPATIDSISIRL